MEFCIGIQSKDAPRLAVNLRRAIGGLAGIHYTSQVLRPKSAPVAAGETILVGLPPGEIPAALRMIKFITAQPGGMPLSINIAAAGLKISFDPRAATVAQLNAVATMLMDTIPA